MLRILNSLSFCWRVVVLLQGDSVKQHYVFSVTPVGVNESLFFFSMSSRKYRWVAFVIFLTCLFQFVSLDSSSFVVQKVRVWLHDCCTS